MMASTSQTLRTEIPSVLQAKFAASDNQAHRDQVPRPLELRADRPKFNRRCRLLYGYALRPWAWELLLWFTAVGLLIAIFTIISQANGKPEREWGLPITLNSLSATLSTIYRGVLVAIAAEIISQDKWIWFWSAPKPTRPLRHLQQFEDASRGMWGALRLVPIVARHSPSTLMATIIIIMALAIGPFVQQSIRTEYRESQLGHGTASLPVSSLVQSSNNYFRTLTHATYSWWDLEANFRGALFSTLTNPSSNDSIIVPYCVSGNCTFPSWDPAQQTEPGRDITHASVGVCSDCTNVTSLVTRTPRTFNMSETYNLPNGMEVIVFDSTPYMVLSTQDTNLSWAEEVIRPERATTYRWAFANVTLLTTTARDESEDQPAEYPSSYVAVTCSLYPCLQSYTASVQNGQLSETLLRSTPLYPDAGNSSVDDIESLIVGQLMLQQSNISFTAVQSPCRINDSFYTDSNMSSAPDGTAVRIFSPENAPDYPLRVAPENCIYRFHSFISTLVGSRLQRDLNGTCTWDSRQGNSIECGEQWWLAPFWEQKHASVQTVIDRFSAIAKAMTNQFRLGTGSEPGNYGRIFGVALQTLPYTVFDWQWLLLPTALLVLETVMLTWMIMRSVRFRGEEMVWKSSLLPLLYYKHRFIGPDGLSIETSRHETEHDVVSNGPLIAVAEMEKDAQHVRVRLHRGIKQMDSNNTQEAEMQDFKHMGGRVRELVRDSLLVQGEEDR
ncbi:hypothetical protein F5X99DRAFT_431981 [Biscogniauxia marginata]|nr:hypothetical protein F5X99DRAFT_431981 [Biscogniauxia marginata]